MGFAGLSAGLRERLRVLMPGWIGRLWQSEAPTSEAEEGQRPQADEAARRLLGEVLGERSSELDRLGYLDVGSSLFPSVVYRLRLQAPIEVYDDYGLRKLARLCVVHGGGLPPADQLLAKLLWLRADEVAFLKIARRMD